MIKSFSIIKAKKSLIKNKDFTLMQAIMLLSPFLSIVLNNLFNLDSNVTAISIGIVCIYFFSLMSFPKLKIKVIIFIFFITTFYLISYLYYAGTVDVKIQDFLFYFVFSILVMIKPAPIERLLLYIMMIGALGILFIDFSPIFVSTYKSISMGMSYALLPIVLATLLHFTYYRSKKSKLAMMLYVINASYFIILFRYAVRGVIISLLSFILLLYVVRYTSNGVKQKKRSFFYYLTIISIFILAIVFLLNMHEIFYTINDFFNTRGINIAFLAKTQRLLEIEDILHGRVPIYTEAIKGFLHSPIWGNGIGVFQNRTGFNYPHNFILQLLFDGGILLTFPVVFIIIRGFIYAVKASYIEDGYPIFVLLVCTSLPRLMFSANIWKTQSFWMLLAFVMVQYNIKLFTKNNKNYYRLKHCRKDGGSFKNENRNTHISSIT